MRNAIRCCIACILPCGALDVIRIVHSNGKVEEISDSHVKASEIMKLHPKHILKKPTSSNEEICSPKIVIVPPDAELKRGNIYFLMPILPSSSSSTRNKKKMRQVSTSEGHENEYSANLLSQILSEKVSTQRNKRRGRVGVWRPHLESISES
ncbi:hypothetical protein RND71_012179 [Anisodus tanguticus]|uniref:Uncharacterized protein n=1 Tax=Anisodus tanguticus TaxID=243964 RepID=A0AAE1SF91_9SOLA|nr:hypothetical protein RND71_012179 [Anisodus tanguticus]